MFGVDIDTLNVYMRTATNGLPSLLYSRFGAVGDYWERADIVISASEDFQVKYLFVFVLECNLHFFLSKDTFLLYLFRDLMTKQVHFG